MKKILIFSLAYYPLIGGAEVAVKEITERLNEGYEWDIITIRISSRYPVFERIGNVNVYRVGLANKQDPDLIKKDFIFQLNKIIYPLLAYFKARELNKKNKYSAAWSIMASYAGLAGLFFKFENPYTPFILTLQEGDTSEHVKSRAGIMLPLFRRIFARADFIHAISIYLIGFAKDFGCQKSVLVIPNGVNTNIFSKREINLGTREIKLITTSRLVEKNGIADLIYSLKFLPDNYVIDIVGTGPLKTELDALVKKEDLKSRVNFIGGLPQDVVVKYLERSDIFVRPSLSEGLGNSFLEAMAVGIPVVGTPVGGIKDFLIDGETGLFCQVNNPQSIASAVMRLQTDNNLRTKIVENSLKLIQTEYDWGIVSARYKKEIFDKILEKKQ